MSLYLKKHVLIVKWCKHSEHQHFCAKMQPILVINIILKKRFLALGTIVLVKKSGLNRMIKKRLNEIK